MELGNVDQALLKQAAWESGLRIDEDSHAGNFSLADPEDRLRLLRAEVALRVGPEIDPQCIHAELNELLRVPGKSYPTDFQGNGRWIEQRQWLMNKGFGVGNQQWALLDILDLFADFLQLGFSMNDELRECGIIGF